MTRGEWLSGTETAETWRAPACNSTRPREMVRGWLLAFLKRRLETRYLEPIRAMQCHLNQQGEGFAIVSLQCALVEFFAALVEGRHFVPGRLIQHGMSTPTSIAARSSYGSFVEKSHFATG